MRRNNIANWAPKIGNKTIQHGAWRGDYRTLSSRPNSRFCSVGFGCRPTSKAIGLFLLLLLPIRICCVTLCDATAYLIVLRCVVFYSCYPALLWPLMFYHYWKSNAGWHPIHLTRESCVGSILWTPRHQILINAYFYFSNGFLLTWKLITKNYFTDELYVSFVCLDFELRETKNSCTISIFGHFWIEMNKYKVVIWWLVMEVYERQGRACLEGDKMSSYQLLSPCTQSTSHHILLHSMSGSSRNSL